MKEEKTFLKNYLNLINQDEAETKPYVCIGQKGNMLYFIKPINVISKMSHKVGEESGICIFAYDRVKHKRTQGLQAVFTDSKNIEGMISFNLDFVSKFFNKYELKTNINYIFRHNIFSQSAKKYLNKA